MCLPQDGVDGTREQSDRMLPSFIGTPSTDQSDTIERWR